MNITCIFGLYAALPLRCSAVQHNFMRSSEWKSSLVYFASAVAIILLCLHCTVKAEKNVSVLFDSTYDCWIEQKLRYDDELNSTLYFRVSEGFQGIPEILLWNSFAFTIDIIDSMVQCIIVTFSFLRKKAWNYGRWDGHCKKLFRPPVNLSDESKSSLQPSSTSDEKKTIDDKHFFSWLAVVLMLEDRDFEQKCGYDSVAYAKFQRILLKYMAISACICLTIIMPLHMHSSHVAKITEFTDTTISRIEPRSQLLLVHAVASVFFFLLAVNYVRDAEADLKKKQYETPSRTVMITNIPGEMAGNLLAIGLYFQSAFPDYTVTDISFAYYVRELRNVSKKIPTIDGALKQLKTARDIPLIYPHRFGYIFFCCKQVPAVDYYTKQLRELKVKQNACLQKALQKPLPICFVSFATREEALYVKCMFSNTRKYGGKTFGNTPTSKYEVKLKPNTWQARMAPAASNVCWHNFGVRFWAIKALLWNSFLFFMLFFLTTPSMAVNLWFKMGHTVFGFSPPENPPWQRALSVLTLMVFTYFLPTTISFAESNNAHWTKSRLQKAVLRKTYVFLLFMILILPSLGLNSGYNFFLYILQPQHVHLRWSCIFMPDNSAFYVNYVITCAFLAKTAELLRLDDLIYHVYQRMACRSKFEFNAALQNSVFEFAFGVEYAHMLAIFSTVCAYSVINPLIAPSGLVFFLIKYYVDRHNIFFAYIPTTVDKAIHLQALHILVFSAILPQLCLFCVLFISSNELSTRNICLLCTLCISFATFVCRIYDRRMTAMYQRARKAWHVLSLKGAVVFGPVIAFATRRFSRFRKGGLVNADPWRISARDQSLEKNRGFPS
ncbi:hypothetical protein M514_05261 [Trichuris suis]|uniref:Uncharacterized protein n=1 Tax=Trichuris suis TaxID=68888 RepID=A0A085M959_9BILA|nr:hypothetical protein M513_05261 [Trichuris suis]KFD71550.1 hypothetical protein M514_05261 [Trichuris suis]